MGKKVKHGKRNATKKLGCMPALTTLILCSLAASAAFSALVDRYSPRATATYSAREASAAMLPTQAANTPLSVARLAASEQPRVEAIEVTPTKIISIATNTEVLEVASATPSATITASPSRTPTIPPKASPTGRDSPTYTPVPTRTMYVNSTGLINVRSCAMVACVAVTTLSPGDEVAVIGEVQGDAVSSNTRWYQVRIMGEIAYIHSSLLSRNPVIVQQPPAGSGGSPGGSGGQPPISTPIPQQGGGYTCNCSRTCTQITSCEEAYFQLNTCGCGIRDHDNDTVPCENICPGG